MELDRRIGLGLLTFYGVGVMVGAGIYVLIGQIAGVAGPATPWAFLVAGAVAGLSAYSFAELSARIPEAAGEAAYVEEAFGSKLLATAVGAGAIAVGVVSAAAILKGGVGYILGLVDLPRTGLEIAVILLLGAIAAVGVVQSLRVAAALTIVEILGLLAIAGAGFAAPQATEPAAIFAVPDLSGAGLGLLFAAALLAFFAFLGFEDMVNMAEETVAPARTMPRAIFLAVALTTALYCLVSVAALLAVPPERLAESERPLALVFSAGTGLSDTPILWIAIAATLNGVLVQIVMVARILYGLGRRRPRLAWFHALDPRFRTPVRGTAAATLAIGALAVSAPIGLLAELTSSVLLAVFTVVNAALVALKRRGPPPPGAPNGPIWLPVLGCLTAAGLLLAGV